MKKAIVRSANIDAVKPIVIGKFTLTATGMEVHGKPTFDEYAGAGLFIQRAHAASGFWLADWLRYGETRTEWKDRLSQVVEATGLAEKTLANVRSVAAIHPSRRRDDVEFGLHAEVVALPGDEQEHWLERCAEEGWTRRELRLEIHASRRTRVIQGQAVLQGKYRVCYADYPWVYGDRPPSGKGASEHYPGLPITEGMKLPVAAHMYPNSVLFFWVTAPLLFEAPQIIQAWGFEPKTQRIWDKVQHNWGHYYSVRHEFLIVATRGSCLPDRPTPMLDSVYPEKPGPHSAKPEQFRKDIEAQWDGPYLELFGRRKVPGWTVFGNDAALWAEVTK